MTASNDVPLDTAKLEALAEFAAGAGHEIHNPVATIVGRVQLLLKEETDPERRQALRIIGGQAYRIRDMIGDLMLFARPPNPDPQSCDLTESVRTVLSTLSQQEESAPISFQLDLDTTVPIWADSTQLAVVISNLIRNSCEAMPSGGEVTIRTRALTEEAGPMAYLSVEDTGPGLTDLDREHLFDPFYSGRQAGRGLGFGLPKCWRIITNHCGRIEVESPGEIGTTFKVYWPASG